ncbi:hypothetical protein J4Q44_G00351240 [Coregonus suidteri]|uniref:Uncharacterized protein n=1 Tax=Coregonus suidteri TaxID=861788 RepID=A0AAN8KGG4_9TELE
MFLTCLPTVCSVTDQVDSSGLESQLPMDRPQPMEGNCQLVSLNMDTGGEGICIMRPSSDSHATIQQWSKLFEKKIKIIENTLSCQSCGDPFSCNYM